MPTFFPQRCITSVGTRSLSSGAHSRDPVALPTPPYRSLFAAYLNAEKLTSSSAKADDPVFRAGSIFLNASEYWMPAFAGMTAGRPRSSYLNAEKRLSNEFGGRIGCEPATWPSLGAGADAAAAGVSEGDGFSGGRAAATCFVSDAAGVDALGSALGAAVSRRCGGGFRLVSMTFGFAGMGGCAVAVVSAPPRPTLRARLLKKPSDCAFGTADATRVAGVGA